MKKEANELLEMLVDISNRIRANRKIEVFKEEIKELTIGQAHILQLLYIGNGKTISELAKNSCVTLATMSENIKRLENLKFVERIHDKKDRRKVYVFITEKGKKIIEAHKKIYLKYLNMLTSALNENEKKVIKNVLNKIIELLKNFK